MTVTPYSQGQAGTTVTPYSQGQAEQAAQALASVSVTDPALKHEVGDSRKRKSPSTSGRVTTRAPHTHTNKPKTILIFTRF